MPLLVTPVYLEVSYDKKMNDLGYLWVREIIVTIEIKFGKHVKKLPKTAQPITPALHYSTITIKISL